MSLINQMLKDLEKRSKRPNHPNIMLTEFTASVVKSKSNFKRYVLLLLSLSCLALLSWAAIHSYLKYHLINLSVIANTPANKMVPAANDKELSTVTGITLQVQDNVTNLRFLLTQDVFYQVSMDPEQHVVIINLKNARTTASVPQLDYLNSALKNVDITPEGQDGLKITMTLNPEAKLNNLVLNKEGKFPELQMDFLMNKLELNNDETIVSKINDEEQFSGTLKKDTVNVSVEQQYQQAVSLASEGETDRAIQLLANVIDKNVGYNAAREQLVTLLLQKGEIEEARRLLAEGLQQQPYYPPFIELKARLLINEGKLKQALLLLQKAPPEIYSNPDYYALIGALYQRVGQFTQAAKVYEQLTSLRPDKGVWWIGLGAALEGMGKNSEAMQAYAKADSSRDLNPQLRGYIGSRLRS